MHASEYTSVTTCTPVSLHVCQHVVGRLVAPILSLYFYSLVVSELLQNSSLLVYLAKFGGHVLHHLASRLANVIRQGGRQTKNLVLVIF